MWFKNFLVERQQFIVHNNIQSSWTTVTSGVYTTGFCVGPLYFLLYLFVNDIHSSNRPGCLHLYLIILILRSTPNQLS